MLQHAITLREHVLPLPTPTDGYTRILFLGTTGAGKTTLVRQFLGTDPSTEHFPSISTAKTTTADLEIILAQGPFQAVVSFLPRIDIRIFVEECVNAAVLAKVEQRTPFDVARKLFEHSDQRFRLSYLLGKLPRPDEMASTQAADNKQEPDQIALSPDRLRQIEAIQGYLHQVDELGNMVWKDIEGQPDFPEDVLKKVERGAFIETFLEQKLTSYQGFHTLVATIMHAIEERFLLLLEGRFTYGQDGWPLSWTFESRIRQDFLIVVNRFSSNAVTSFGRLLTPLVQGIRVRGPFQPVWGDKTMPRVVLIDGEGLGHIHATANSLPTHITIRFEQVDAIVLVDNAEQPMQAAPGAVLRTVAASGHLAKLFVCFTHFEAVDGINFADEQDRRDHVRSSLENVLTSVGKDLGSYTSTALRQRLEHHVFFLSSLEKKNPPESAQTQLQTLIKECSALHLMHQSMTMRPVYEEKQLFSFLRQAVHSFREAWQGRLGLNPESRAHPEHWNSIKTLSRRIAEQGLDEHKHLRPVADLIRETMEQVKQFLDTPRTWEFAAYRSEEERQAIIDAIAKTVYTHLHALARTRIIVEYLPDWQTAYRYSGTGSTKRRARAIEHIYGVAAPLPHECDDEEMNIFLRQAVLLVRDAILLEGGKLV